MTMLLILFLAGFAALAWHRFFAALALFFFLLPTYLIRFPIGPLPTTLLELMFLALAGVWLIKNWGGIPAQMKTFGRAYPVLASGVCMFLLAATVSVFASVGLRTALGEWRAFYAEPVVLAFIIAAAIKNETPQTAERIRSFIFSALILSGLATAVFAVIQKYTGWFVPWAFWENQNTFRVTAWYGFPNAVGLYLAPLLPLALHNARTYWKRMKAHQSRARIMPALLFGASVLFVPLAFAAILFAKSTGALFGALAGVGLLLLLYKKTRLSAFAIGLFVLVAIFSLPQFSPLKQEVLLQDRSGQIRIAMWKETWELLKDRPFFGAGIASYEERIAPYHTTVNGEGIEIFHHPHNLFLTMWVNTGLLGFLAFLIIMAWIFMRGAQRMRQEHHAWSATPFLLASMITILVMGLVDAPYIKNDLAFLFWLFPALMIGAASRIRMKTLL